MRELNRRLKRGILMSEVGAAETFGPAALVGLVLTVVFAAALIIWAAPLENVVVVLAAIFLHYLMGLLGGAVLRVEYTSGRVDERTRVPVFYTFVLLILLAVSFMSYTAEPSFFFTQRLLDLSFVVPVLRVFIMAFVYDLLYRFGFFFLLERQSNVDYHLVLNKGEVVEKLSMFWEYLQRYNESLFLLILRLVPKNETAEAPASDFEKLIRMMQEKVDEKIRKADLTGRYSSDTIWVIFSHTHVSDAEKPITRISEAIENDESFRRVSSIYDFRTGVGEYDPQMQSPTDLLNQALERVGIRVSGV